MVLPGRVAVMKSGTEKEFNAEFNEIGSISYFKMLALASETSIYARTAEMYCNYLMTLSVLRYVLKCSKTSVIFQWGSGGRAVERRTINRGDGGSIPPTAVSKLRQVRSPHICLGLSEETLKAGGPFYLVSMPGEVKDPTQGVIV